MISIFEEIKKLDTYCGNEGTLEMRYLYSDKTIPMEIQISSSNLLINSILTIYENNDFSLSFNENIPLICYFNVFISKLDAMINEEIIKESWIRDFTKKLIYFGKTKNEVKLGLILSGKYLESEKLKEIVDVFSKSGEYIFYLITAIRNVNKFNSYLFNLAKLSSGTIKVFAITNMEIFNDDINTYLIEEGYKDNKYEDFLINYIFSIVSISNYLKVIEGNTDKINKLAYVIVNYLRTINFSLTHIKYELIQEYLIQIALFGDSFYALYSIFLIKEGICKDKNIKCDKSKLNYYIEGLLKEDRWSEIFNNGIKNVEGNGEEIIALSNFYNYKLSFEDIKPYLEKERTGLDLYWYIYQKGNLEDRKKTLDFFLSKFNISKLINDIKDIPTESLTKEHIESILFSIIIKLSKDIYPEGLEIAIYGLRGNINEIRESSIKTIIKYKDKLSKDYIEKIKEAYSIEPNSRLKTKLSIILEDNKGKKEFVDTFNLEVQQHQKDIYLLSSEVAGVKYRDKILVEKELKNSRLFYLQWEKNNKYDDRAIKIVGQSGFVIGYIKKSDNFILCNLLRGGKYLYCKVKEFDLYKDYIAIKIYLSYKDVENDVNETIRMILSSTAGDLVN